MTSQPSGGNTNPAPATPPFFLTEPVSDLAITYFYGHLFAAEPEIGSMFPAAMDAQRHRFYRALYRIVVTRDGQLDEYLAELGRAHRKFGVRKEHYALELEYPWLEVHPATSEEEAEGVAHSTIPILGAKAAWDDSDVYISGPDAMIVKTASALRTRGTDPARLHYDLPDEN